MKKFLILFAFFVSFNSLSTIAAPTTSQVIQSSDSWTYTTGYHSDGTSVKVRYYESTYQVYYSGNWCSTSRYYDSEYKRYYVKTPANKRYYI